MNKSASKELADGLTHLSLSNHTIQKHPTKKKVPIVESWDDEPEEPSDNEEATPPAETSKKIPSPPPPTPQIPHTLGQNRNSSSVPSTAGLKSPREVYIGPDTFARDGGPSGAGGERGERPTKTDAVARRMISAALGVRTKSTKEQREYDIAVRTAEKKRKEEDNEKKKLEEKEKERMKAAIWED
ncbi:hypothetical protein Q9L58_001064 [Maublancomyces gigas]|uniref:Uncharacterized protein n=1 Tax=Discina gigas TaxID=1032678 RepID=A0ABR3GW74_9PEZI